MLGRICTRQGYRLCRPASRRMFRKNYSVPHEPVFERVDIPCGVSTPITIKIHNPPSSSSTNPLPILLYITTHPPSSPPPPTPLPLLSPSHTTIHISPPSSPLPFPHPLHKLLYAYTHIISLLRPAQTRSYAQPPTRYPPIALYGSSSDGTGGALATALALTEALTARRAGRYPSALITTDSLFDFSPLAIAALHPSTAISSLTPLKIKKLFANPPSTLDPLASPLLLFRGSAFHSSAFPSSWSPTSTPSPLLSDADLTSWMASPAAPTTTASPEELPDNDAPVDADPTRAQKRSYLKFPPANLGLRLPMCNFQISHALPSPPSKPSKPSKSTKSSKPSSTASESAPEPPLETTQAHLMASAINRSVRMGYDAPLPRRGDDQGEDERAAVSELDGEGDVEELGAVGAREWLRETMDWQ